MADRRNVGLRGAALVVAIGLSAVGSACASAPRVQLSRAAPSDEFLKPPPPSPSAAADGTVEITEPGSFNAFVNGSEAAVTGTITNVSEPKWNSTSGEAWTRDGSGKTQATPTLYRDVLVHVTEVPYASNGINASPGDDITVRLYGDGSATGGEVGGGPPGMRWNEISGPVQTGTQVLFVLYRGPFYIQKSDGYTEVEVIRLFGHFYGNWKIENGTAVNADRRRTVPVEPLKQRIREERAAGLRPGDQSGRYNPLGD